MGVSGLTPAASGTPAEKIAADIKGLLAGLGAALRPVLIANTVQAASIGLTLPGGAAVPMIPSPYLAAGTVIAVDAAAFASIVGAIDISSTEEAVVHVSDTWRRPALDPRHQLVAAQNQRGVLDERHSVVRCATYSNLILTRVRELASAVTDEKIVERVVCDHVEALLDQPASDAIKRVLQLTSVIASFEKRARP